MEDDTKHVVLLECDTVNKNGRIYPKGTVEKMLEMRIERPMLATMGGSDMMVNLNHASHVVEDLYLQDNKLMAKMRVLGTPMGNIAKSLSSVGCEMDFVVCGHGKVDPLNGMVSEFEMTHVSVVEPGRKA